MEIDICQDTADDPPLWHAGQGRTIAQALQTSCTQKAPHQILVVLDTASEQAHQLAISNCIATGTDVALGGLVIAVAIHQTCGQLGHRILRAPVEPEALAITVTNVVAGWTVLGWLVALIWACTMMQSPPQAATPEPPTAGPSPPAARPTLPTTSLTGRFAKYASR